MGDNILVIQILFSLRGFNFYLFLTSMDFYTSMGAGRKTKTLPLKEKPEDKWTVNCSVSARNLRKADLGAVIFGCKHYTIKECQLKQLFGQLVLSYGILIFSN